MTDATRDEVRAKIFEIVREQSDPWRPANTEIGGGTVLDDLKIDSVDVIEMMFAVEEAYPDIQVPDDAFTIESTVDQVVDAVQRHLGVVE